MLMDESPICQSHLPIAPWMTPATRRLPGVQPVRDGKWLFRDDAFDQQMAQRDRLVALKRAQVIASAPAGAAHELLQAVLRLLRRDDGYQPVMSASGDVAALQRPDGIEVPLDLDDPLKLLARLVQEDLLILTPGPRGEHVLDGGILCFPASWTLSQKTGRPLSAIHDPVTEYDHAMARRVQRIIDNLAPASPVWRANWLRYNDPTLYQPRREKEIKPFTANKPWFMRVEYQTIMKLPKSGALVFGIHTFQVARAALTREQRASLDAELAKARTPEN